MMRVLLLSIMMIIAGSAARADKDSWKQVCNDRKGQFSVLKQENQDLALCFFEESAIGAEALYQLKSEGTVVDSVKAYRNRRSSSVRGGVCGAFEAEHVMAKDSQGNIYNLCLFEDKSVMEETTLWLGPGSSGSALLEKAITEKNISKNESTND